MEGNLHLIGAGLVVIGAGLGIGRIGGSAKPVKAGGLYHGAYAYDRRYKAYYIG